MIVQVGKKVIEYIFAEETGGKAWYEKIALHPVWPKGSSGITVGGGYDCGYSTPERIAKDWGGLIPDSSVKLLQSIAGLRGVKAQNALTSQIIKGVTIPYDVAYKQYLERVIKGEVALTISAFPEAEKLNPDTVGVLTSIVYNRGTKMNDIDPKAQDRREMRVIKSLVPKKDYKGIAAQIRSMKRLWDGIPDYEGDHEQRFIGLVKRRESEAVIVDKSERVYKPEEIISFTI